MPQTSSVLFNIVFTNRLPSSSMGALSLARGGADVSVGTPPIRTASGSPPSR